MVESTTRKVLRFSSVLGADHLKELQNLLFFSRSQQQVSQDIRRSIQLYGLPKIVRYHGSLRVSIGLFRDAQTLFALQDGPLRHRVVGVVVCVRHPEDSLTIVQMAVADEYVMANARDEIPLALQLFSEVLKAARQIKGIMRVRVIYGKGKILEVRVCHNPLNDVRDQTISLPPKARDLPHDNDQATSHPHYEPQPTTE